MRVALGLLNHLVRWRRPALHCGAVPRLARAAATPSTSMTGVRGDVLKTLCNDLNNLLLLQRRAYAVSRSGGRGGKSGGGGAGKSTKGGKTCKGDGPRTSKTADPDDERMLSDGGGSKDDFGKIKEVIKKTKPRSTIEKVIPGKEVKNAAKVVKDTAKKGVDSAKKKVKDAVKKVKDTGKPKKK